MSDWTIDETGIAVRHKGHGYSMSYHVPRMVEDLDQLRTKLAAAVEVLREIEWAGNHRDNTCPDCHAFRDDQAMKIPGGPEREWHHIEEWRKGRKCGLRAVLLANQDLPLTTTAPLPDSPGA